MRDVIEKAMEILLSLPEGVDGAQVSNELRTRLKEDEWRRLLNCKLADLLDTITVADLISFSMKGVR